MKVTEEMVAAFKEAWHYEDTHGQVGAPEGARTTKGLQAVLDLIERQEWPEAHADPSMINLRGVSEDSTVMTVSREEYEQAKREGMLDHMLDVYLSDMDGETYVIEPDGTVVRPYA